MSVQMRPIGKLYLIPTTLGDNAPLEVLPISIKRTMEPIRNYIVENEKSARKFIKKVSPRKSQARLNIEVLNKYTDKNQLPAFLAPCLKGVDMGLLSEAGCPGIADPGAEVVLLAHELNIAVVPLVGPSAILLAMMASGMNGQHFTFNGYLPIENKERRNRIKLLERLSRENGSAQIFIETPYRNDKLLAELLKVLASQTLLCMACDLTLPTEYIATKSVADWKKVIPGFHKRPAIFIIQA
jgi:16S rRNA (cytidine1402-2'-O)-methyltransferase